MIARHKRYPLDTEMMYRHYIFGISFIPIIFMPTRVTKHRLISEAGQEGDAFTTILVRRYFAHITMRERACFGEGFSPALRPRAR